MKIDRIKSGKWQHIDEDRSRPDGRVSKTEKYVDDGIFLVDTVKEKQSYKFTSMAITSSLSLN
ncbi:MAG: hypothetical protein LUJ25_02290 [Firmicutes bacterium]|nr:hypothetical protein [Bacillota bacterium]